MTDPHPHGLALSRRALRDVGRVSDAPALDSRVEGRRAYRRDGRWATSIEPVAVPPESSRRELRSTGRSAPVASVRTAGARRDFRTGAVQEARWRAAPPSTAPEVQSAPRLRRDGRDAGRGSQAGSGGAGQSTPIAPCEVATPTDAQTPLWAALARAPAALHAPALPVAIAPSGVASAAPSRPNGPDTPAEDAPAPARPLFRSPPPPAPPPAPATPAPLLPRASAVRPPARHARRAPRRSGAPLRLAAAAGAAVALVLGGSVAVGAAVTGTPVSALTSSILSTPAAEPQTAEPLVSVSMAPPPAAAPPAEIAEPQVAALPEVVDPCAEPTLATALQGGDDAGAVAALGGGEQFRSTIVSGGAACVNLGDPGRLWVVVDKLRPLDPVDFAPASLTLPEGVRSVEGGELRADASAAMSAMVLAAAQAGAGEIAVQSAYRSYTTQESSYGNHVSDRGTEGADMVSARPGHSEHQTGLAADVVACDSGGCGTLDGLAATPQGQWVAAHAWEFGWIVRYEEGHTAVTGYSPEPWHLRYIGPDLARAYHEGGWHTLEEFFALPAAPDYAG